MSVEAKHRPAVALIGAGMVARTHLAAITASEQVALRAVYARRLAQAQELAGDAALNGAEAAVATDDLTRVAQDTDVDFAIILTPPDARASVIRPLALAGKHILLEKPVGRNAQEAREVIRICRDAGVTLGIVLQHRMRAASIAAADLVASGQLGALGLVQITVPWWREQSYYDEPGRGSYARDGGGVLISQAIHTLDLALSLTGPVRSLRALAATTRFHRMEAEDFVSAGLEFANGAVGSLVASTASFPGGAETITLHFDQASLHLEAGQLQVSWRDGRNQTLGATTGTGGGADPMGFTHDWHQSIIEDFAQAVQTGRAPAIPGEAALPVHDLIEALERSARSGQPQELLP